jgi:hypothetical protein
MPNVTYDKQVTALLVIDPYNDFISEGGKLWSRLKAVAEANGCVPHMSQVLNAARKAGLRVFYALHRPIAKPQTADRPRENPWFTDNFAYGVSCLRAFAGRLTTSFGHRLGPHSKEPAARNQRDPHRGRRKSPGIALPPSDVDLGPHQQASQGLRWLRGPETFKPYTSNRLKSRSNDFLPWIAPHCLSHSQVVPRSFSEWP